MYVVKSKVGARYPVLKSTENQHVSVRSNIYSSQIMMMGRAHYSFSCVINYDLRAISLNPHIHTILYRSQVYEHIYRTFAIKAATNIFYTFPFNVCTYIPNFPPLQTYARIYINVCLPKHYSESHGNGKGVSGRLPFKTNPKIYIFYSQDTNEK